VPGGGDSAEMIFDFFLRFCSSYGLLQAFLRKNKVPSSCIRRHYIHHPSSSSSLMISYSYHRQSTPSERVSMAFASTSYHRSPPSSSTRIPSADRRLCSKSNTLKTCSAIRPNEIQNNGKIEIKKVDSDADIRGAACVRALCFYSYPKDRSEFSIRAHRLTKIEAEFEAISNKITGKDVSYKNNDVFCYVAVEERVRGDNRVPEDPAIVIPGEKSAIVCGTLDLNVGVNLPAEELVGKFPIEGNARKKRCYMSNVCVLESRRNLGIARQLIERAIEDAKNINVEEIYVHVVSENIAAKRLYEKAGFVVESEESAKEALTRMHEPRQILRYRG
jgi:ribosomal protein S18 acetylase RimI-like enzyme